MAGDSSNEAEIDYFDVRGDGRIVLYQRPGLRRQNWYVRVRVPNATGYKILSSKTSDFDEAKRFAKGRQRKPAIRLCNSLADRLSQVPPHAKILQNYAILQANFSIFRKSGD